MSAQAAGLADRPELASLWRAVRRHAEQRGAAAGRITLALDDAVQARALTVLLGRRRPWLAGDRARIDLAALDARLAHMGGVRAVLEVGGPVRDRRLERAAAAAAAGALWDALAGHAAAGDPAISGWLDEQRRGGRWHGPSADLASSRQVLGDCLDVVAVLPAGGVGLPRLAADVLADPHALDDDRPAGRAILGLLEALHGECERTGAARRRWLWAQAGVRVGTQEPVRCLGLRPEGDGPLARRLREYADLGWPQLITEIELAAEPPVLHGPVFCCENREVLDAAVDTLGIIARPLICVDGWPTLTVSRMLDRLVPGQARHHGDFDWGGWRIAQHLRARHAIGSWRYDVDHYREAVAARPHVRARLRGRSPGVAQRDALAGVLAAVDHCVSEEQVLDQLLGDLTR